MSATNNLMSIIHSRRLRSSAEDDDAGSAEDDGGLPSCDGIPAALPSPQMTRSTTPAPGTVTVHSHENHSSSEGESSCVVGSDDTIGAEPERHTIHVSEAVAHDDQDPVDDDDAALADDDELEDYGTRPLAAMQETWSLAAYDILLQELDPERIVQLSHVRQGEANTQLQDAIMEVLNPAIARGRLRRHPLAVQAAAAAAGAAPAMGTTEGQEEEAYRGGGFGGVPASAAAIAGLEKQRYDGGDDDASSGDDGGEGCVICLVDYEAGDELSLMPCASRHRFHEECLGKWLARSHLCPLCRHELPTPYGGP